MNYFVEICWCDEVFEVCRIGKKVVMCMYCCEKIVVGLYVWGVFFGVVFCFEV